MTQFRRDGLIDIMKVSNRLGIPLGGLHIQNERLVYIQFASQCESRFSLSNRLFSEMFPRGVFVISKEHVEPGLHTIDLEGPSWRN